MLSAAGSNGNLSTASLASAQNQASSQKSIGKSRENFTFYARLNGFPGSAVDSNPALGSRRSSKDALVIPAEENSSKNEAKPKIVVEQVDELDANLEHTLGKD